MRTKNLLQDTMFYTSSKYRQRRSEAQFRRNTDTVRMVKRAGALAEDVEFRRTLAEIGHSIAASKHAYVHRAKRILEDFARI